jgi:hypothetical protein
MRAQTRGARAVWSFAVPPAALYADEETDSQGHRQSLEQFDQDGVGHALK